jgi:L-lactate utilization protein LutB
MKTQISFAGVLRLATLGLLAPIGAAFATVGPGEASVPQVLEEVKAHAAEAKYDADFLDSSVRNHADWQSYSIQLHHIRLHANELFHDNSRLQKIADKATPQQREAIKRLQPMVREMADSLTKTIQWLNENQGNVGMPEFTSQIHSTYVNIDKLYQELCKCTENRSS